MNLRDFQMWLNAHGASPQLIIDGKGGPVTRKAILDTFINLSAKTVSTTDILGFATHLGGTVHQLNAVAKVESAGGGWDDKGRLKSLFERHYAWRRLQVLIPFLSNPTPGGYTIDADKDGINDSWEKVSDLAMKNPLVAFESASWGKFQIMGAHAKSLGYSNAIEFVWMLSRSEAEQYKALTRFIEINNLKGAFQKLSTNPADCLAFARGYNGKGQKGYDRRLADAMR